MEASAINVVIIGGKHHNTLGVIRSLGEQGIPSERMEILIVGDNVSPENFISMSKYITKSHIHYVDYDCQIISFLHNLASDGERRVVICCSDGSAEMVILHKEELKYAYDTPSTRENIENLMKKDFQGEKAVECGLIVPFSKVINKNNLNLEWTMYPCITKPYKSSAGAGKADIKISNNADELNLALKETGSEEIQIQHYIEKQMEFQIIGCSLDCGEQIIIPGFTKIIRQPANTNTGYLVYRPINQLEFDIGSVKQFIRSIGYSGLFSVEFIRGTDGIDYFLEINMRNDGNAYCVKSAGINLPYIWTYYQIYKTMPDVPTTFEGSVYFIPDFNDVRQGIKEDGIFKWMGEFLHAQSHSIFNMKDLKPFLFESKKRISIRTRKQYVKP